MAPRFPFPGSHPAVPWQCKSTWRTRRSSKARHHLVEVRGGPFDILEGGGGGVGGGIAGLSSFSENILPEN